MSAPAKQSVDSRVRAVFFVRSLLCPFHLGIYIYIVGLFLFCENGFLRAMSHRKGETSDLDEITYTFYKKY